MENNADIISFEPQDSIFRATGKIIKATKKANAIGISTDYEVTGEYIIIADLCHTSEHSSKMNKDAD